MTRTTSELSRSGLRPGAAWRGLVVLASALGVFAAPAVAEAQLLQRLSFRGEAGAGTMISSYQSSRLGYGLLFQGTARAGLQIAGPLGVQASFGSWFLPSDQRGDGQLYSLTLGLRGDFAVGSAGYVVLDANGGLGLSGGLSRFGFDAGLGFELALGQSFALGPLVRYSNLQTSAQDFPSDAAMVSVGLSASLRFPEATPEAPPPPADTDSDGVLDPDDLCVREPAGEHPDPSRRGCPLHDGDGDGVYDNEDVCVNQPAGNHPDPNRRGCPASDSDNDTVFDHEDQCPSTPQGVHPDPERRGCPDGDTDSDGVVNHEDRCPTVHYGLHVDPARPGCPCPDADHDGVCDANDACPQRPGGPDPDPRRNGCNNLVRVVGGAIQIIRPVFFAVNRDVILPRSRPVLQAVANALRATPEIRRVSIEGHTDDVADDAFNMTLSQRRANNVMAWLIASGIDAGRIEAHGFGETRPLVEARTASARALNRRVEFRIVDPLVPADGSGATSPR